MHPTTLAIDFGTSNSLCGAWHQGRRVEALALDPTAPDPTLMRTLLYFPEADRCFYGAEAIAKYLEFEMEGRLFRSFKSHLPNRNYLGTFVGSRPVTLETMVGTFLLEMRKRAEEILNAKIEHAVIGKPARYAMDPMGDEFALYRMGKAAEMAGFKSFRFVPEPLAAALDARRQIPGEKIALIGDFGGGTSDFTLIRIGPFRFEKNHVLAIEGCPQAGDVLDSVFMSEKLNAYFGAKAEYKMSLGNNRLRMPKSIMERLNKPAHIVHLKEKDTYEFIRQVRLGTTNMRDREAIDRLFLLIQEQQAFSFFEHIEKTKRALSAAASAQFTFDYPGLEMQEPFSRLQFETWAEPMCAAVFKALDECLNQASLKISDVDLVCLTGGTAQVPMIRDEFRKRFGEEKLQTQSHFHSVLSGLIESAGMEP
ncbi:MAG TPA: Hsp70 family protein [Bdellovibrionales bacterium]|nr:Hsp70 family protein [Bdellovibrionales bacterium]